MSTPANTYWTDSRMVELRSLCEQGLSYRQIAARMGGGITSSAVIGKAGRFGISNGRHQPLKQQTLQNIKKRRPKQKQKAKPMLPPAPPPLPFVLAPEIPVPLAQRKTVHELENAHCRWPYGEPAQSDFYFCGAPTANLAEGIPYCPAHFRVAYRQR